LIHFYKRYLDTCFGRVFGSTPDIVQSLTNFCSIPLNQIIDHGWKSSSVK